MSVSRNVTGSVRKLVCSKCGCLFPHFIFSGENDADTAGLGSASSPMKNEIVISELTSTEWNSAENGGLFEFQKRLSLELSRDDLRVVRLLRVVRNSVDVAGLNFQEYLKGYVPPTLIYACPCCEGGEVTSVCDIAIDDFQSEGGNILVMGTLRLVF